MNKQNSNLQISQITNQAQNPKFDLETRTLAFGVSVVELSRLVSLDTVTKPMVSQLVRSGTSIGANYREANGADSKKDFKAKISICKKEAKETMYWLELLSKTVPKVVDKARRLWTEAHELSLIFGAINRKL